MIKDTFYFSKNSWHMNLMSWIWGYKPNNFRNMGTCFWLSVFNVVFIIPIIVIKIVISLIILLGDFISRQRDRYMDYCDRKEQEYINTVYAQIKKDIKEGTVSEDFKKLSLAMYSIGKTNKLWRDVLSRMSRKERASFDTQGESVLDDYYRNRRQEEKKKAQKVAAIKNNPVVKTTEQIIGKIIPVIKLLFKVLGIGLIGWIGYLLYRLGVYMSIHMDFHKLGHILGLIGIAIIIIAAIITIIALICMGIKALACRFGDYCIPCEKRRVQLMRFFSFIGKIFYIFYPIIWLIKGLIFLWEIAVALKKDNCPALVWKEDE